MEENTANCHRPRYIQTFAVVNGRHSGELCPFSRSVTTYIVSLFTHIIVSNARDQALSLANDERSFSRRFQLPCRGYSV